VAVKDFLFSILVQNDPAAHPQRVPRLFPGRGEGEESDWGMMLTSHPYLPAELRMRIHAWHDTGGGGGHLPFFFFGVQQEFSGDGAHRMNEDSNIIFFVDRIHFEISNFDSK